MLDIKKSPSPKRILNPNGLSVGLSGVLIGQSNQSLP